MSDAEPYNVRRRLLDHIGTAALEIALTIIVIIALYVVASPRFGERAYHSALFAPWKYPIGNYDGELGKSGRYEDVYFKAVDGKKLHGWFFQGTKPITLLVHHGKTGNLTDLEKLMQLLLETGASLLMYDYRGFGRSEGSPSLKVICEDGMSAYQYLIDERKIPANQIVPYGESLGGLVACHQAERVEIAGLILQSAFSSLRRISIENVGALCIFPELLFPECGRNAATVERLDKPVLVIHGALDADIVPDHSHQLHGASRSDNKLVLLPHTLHDEIDQQDFELFVQSVNSFLSSLAQERLTA